MFISPHFTLALFFFFLFFLFLFFFFLFFFFSFFLPFFLAPPLAPPAPPAPPFFKTSKYGGATHGGATQIYGGASYRCPTLPPH